MPPGIVEEEDDGLVRPGAGGLGEGLEDSLEEGDIDGIGEPPLDVPDRRADEGLEIEPLLSVAAECKSAPRSDPAEYF